MSSQEKDETFKKVHANAILLKHHYMQKKKQKKHIEEEKCRPIGPFSSSSGSESR